MAEAMDTSERAAVVKTEQSETDDDERKIFVGGLPQEVQQEDIATHFQTFGELQSVTIKTDAATGRSRGFAFVVFQSVSGLQAAVAAEGHAVKGKDVAVKLAQAKQGKVYVGKLKAELTDEVIEKHFEQFGKIVQVEQPFDKIKNKRKNFCFITFEREEAARRVLKAGSTTIAGAGGLQVEVNSSCCATRTPASDSAGCGVRERGAGRRGQHRSGQGQQEQRQLPGRRSGNLRKELGMPEVYLNEKFVNKELVL